MLLQQPNVQEEQKQTSLRKCEEDFLSQRTSNEEELKKRITCYYKKPR
jgi:hypothetical protein